MSRGRSLAGKVVVITGASAGVGRAAARAFAEAGADVGLLGRGSDGLRAAAEEASRSRRSSLAIEVDVADPGGVEAAAARIERELGPIDVWVNNAMVSVFSPAAELRAEEVLRVTEVTYLGAVYGTLAALRRMRPRDRGTIVQVGSALAYRGIPLQSLYCGAKHGLQGFTESVRTELLHDRSRVRISMVHLPGLNTPHFQWVRSRLPRRPQPVPPIYQPEVAARAIVHAARHAPRELKVGWPTLASIWGNRIAPSFLDRYLARTGYDSQQTNEPADPDRPDNLWRPVPGDHGAHGSFDARARRWSPQLELAMRPWIALVTVGGVLLWRGWRRV